MKSTIIIWSLFMLLLASCNSSQEDIDYKLIPVQQGGRFGYVNLKGEYEINPQFDEAYMFREGIALVKKEGKYGYIRKDGSYLCIPTYIEATPFQEGIAWTVKEKEAPVAIDKNGNKLFSAENFYHVFCYSEGLAAFSMRTDDGDIKFGYLNKKGEIVIPPIYSQAKSFSQGLASVKDDKSMTGYIDSKGNLKINYQYANGERFNKQGLAIVLAPESEYYGVIDKNGKYVINPQFEYMFADDNGYIIRLDKHGDYGYCDMQGKLIINPQFQHMHKFGNTSLAPVASGGAVGFVDKKGKMIIQPQFESASCFNGNYAVAGTAGKFGFIDESGKYIVNPQFQAIGEDFKYSKYEIKSTPYNSVESRYINIDKIADKIKKLLTNDKLDGMSFPPSVQEIQARYKIEDSEIPVYSDLKTSLGYWDNNVSANLLLNGYFYKEVSDGWWGTNRVIDKLAKADKIQLSINLFYLAFGRSDDLVLGLSKVLNKGYENYTFDIRSKGKNNVIINISRQK